MQLRDYQIEFVDKCVDALLERGNTLGVAPTGAGKTVMLASVIKKLHERKKFFKVCVLAHRKELTEQNIEKFLRVNPHITTSIVNAEEKNWSGEVTFAMVQTLSNKRTLHSIPALDLLVIDETHHITANSYGKIIKQAKSINPNAMIFGVTATPNRGDKRSLGKIFTNCAEQIYLADLIDDGHLVEPQTFIIDVAQEELRKVKKTALGDYSEGQVANILGSRPVLDQVLKVWLEKASDRKTVVFCSTIEHANNVAKAFNTRQIPASVVSSAMTKEEREDTLRDLIVGKIQVIVNVAILTEGWDFPPISCVVLLRQSSYKSTMIQMIGRGLRTIDPAIYPGIEKKDCIVLDFGISSVLHKTLDDQVNLERRPKRKGEAPTKECPECNKYVPIRVKECVFCGYEFDQEPKEVNVELSMKQINMIERSNLDWSRPEQNKFFVSGFNVWASMVKADEQWIVAVGSNNKEINVETQVIYQGTKHRKAQRAAECFMRENDSYNGINKNAVWKNAPASEKQLELLKPKYRKQELSKGEASTLLAFQFNAEKQLRNLGLVA